MTLMTLVQSCLFCQFDAAHSLVWPVKFLSHISFWPGGIVQQAVKVAVCFACLHLRRRRSSVVYQGLSHGLIEIILFGINVRPRFIKVSVHLEVQLSMSISVKHKSQLKVPSARFRPCKSALAYCQI